MFTELYLTFTELIIVYCIDTYSEVNFGNAVVNFFIFVGTELKTGSNAQVQAFASRDVTKTLGNGQHTDHDMENGGVLRNVDAVPDFIASTNLGIDHIGRVLQQSI